MSAVDPSSAEAHGAPFSAPSLTGLPVFEFLDAVASPEPTPGGGSVAALCGALSGALAAMAAGLTIGKRGFEEVSAAMERIQVEAHDLRGRLKTAVTRDSQAYETVMDAFALPKTTDDEKASRKAAIQAAMKHAALVPLEVAGLSDQCARLSGDVLARGNPNTATDAGVALLLAATAIEGACLNVAVNLDAVKDEEFVAEHRAALQILLKRASAHRTEAWNTLSERLASLEFLKNR